MLSNCKSAISVRFMNYPAHESLTTRFARTVDNAPETIFSMSGMTAKRDTCHRIIRYGRTLGFGHNCKPCLRNPQLKRRSERRDSNPFIAFFPRHGS